MNKTQTKLVASEKFEENHWLMIKLRKLLVTINNGITKASVIVPMQSKSSEQGNSI